MLIPGGSGGFQILTTLGSAFSYLTTSSHCHSLTGPPPRHLIRGVLSFAGFVSLCLDLIPAVLFSVAIGHQFRACDTPRASAVIAPHRTTRELCLV